MGERVLPLYKLLKKSECFEWSDKVQRALDEVKRILSNPSVLTPLALGEPLLLYVVGTNQVVSIVLVVEREEEGHVLQVQRPVYYITEMLSDSKTRYPQILKFIYAVMVARRKLRHYFNAHSITVVSSFPLKEVIHNKDSMGEVEK